MTNETQISKGETDRVTPPVKSNSLTLSEAITNQTRSAHLKKKFVCANQKIKYFNFGGRFKKSPDDWQAHQTESSDD